MRVTRIAASVLALGSFLGGLTAAAHGSETVKHRTAAVAPLTDVAAFGTGDNNGNG
ncbi:hypothetical protein [Streptomyces sp. NPDC005423]|uniref:hypothetical protein n=1 Tax=Streptomyces sp. NPDC005423 TaxID=3155343 RepID=UPI0033AFC265